MSKRSLRVIFAGTPEFASRHLGALIESKHVLAGVYTQPDRRAGRGRKLQASPVKRLAEEAGLAIHQPPSLKDEAVRAQLSGLEADLMVVVAYGLILPQAVLDIPRLGCLNVHASLLPRWRGAAPIQRAIEAGDSESGITIMQMDAGLDTGAMLATAACEIGPRTSAAGLQSSLASLGPPLLPEVLDDIERRQREGQAQDDAQATYAHKIQKSEAEMDWSLDAGALDCKVRAFNPAPVCYSFLGDRRVRVWQARPLPRVKSQAEPGTILRAGPEGIVVRCGDGELALESLQLEGGKPLSSSQLLSAHQSLFQPGARFSARAAGE